MRRGDQPATYNIGDAVFWGTLTTAGEYTFIGHPKGDKAGKVLVLALGAEIGFEVDADECRPVRAARSAAESIGSVTSVVRAG